MAGKSFQGLSQECWQDQRIDVFDIIPPQVLGAAKTKVRVIVLQRHGESTTPEAEGRTTVARRSRRSGVAFAE